VRTPRALAATARDATAFARHRARGHRPLLKDPIAVFSAEWLADRLDADVVVTIRHPAGFASSLARLGWTHRFEQLADQPLLLRDHLGPFAAEIRAHAERPRPVLEQAALLWRAIYATVLRYQERHPDWLFVRHEDAVRNPLGVYEALYDRLGLQLTGAARRAIREQTDGGDPGDVWRTRLSAQELAWLRAATADVSPAFYADDEW
jgi:hypothetical protein